MYKQLKDQGKKVEVIFVTSDRSEADMYSYMEEAHGDWYAIKFDDEARGWVSWKIIFVIFLLNIAFYLFPKW